MHNIESKLPKTLLCFLALTSFLFVCSLYAGQPIKVAGTMTTEITEADTLAISDVEGHQVSLQVYEGTNASTGEIGFMDGAAVRNISYADMVQGNGIHHGYCEFTNDEGTTIAKWQGKVTTTLAADSTTVTSFEGKFSFIGGTGKFANIQGNGTYTGSFTSKTTFIADWAGEYTLGE